MTTRTVYQLDDDGFLVGSCLADESLEKGVFLIPSLCVETHPLAAVAGKRQKFVNGSFQYVDIPVEPPPPPKTLEELKQEKLAEINSQCNQRINGAVLSYPFTEILTFPKQEGEARAFVADNAAPTPLMDALSASRGIGKADLAARIIAKADFFAAYTGAVIGHRQKLEDQVNAEGADLSAIDPLAGWPT